MNLNPVQITTDAATTMAHGFLANLPQVAIALVVLGLTPLVGRFVRAFVAGFMKRTRTRQALVTLGTNLAGIIVWIVGVAIAIMVVFPSVTPAQFIAGLGIGSVAIGFAFKDVFENFLAGVIILAREKMQIGDVIECEGVYGRIENIWIRETHVRRVDGELVIVPNAFLFQNPLRIQTDEPRIRQELVVGVDYATDLPTARTVLIEALESCVNVDKNKEIAVQCIAFADSSINFQIMWWCDSQPKAQREAFDEVAFAVKAALDRAGITIPFPQSTLSFRPEAFPVRVTNDAPQDGTT
jgi:small-conductance mechanosensitive channel